jgi:hypothetical protein
MKSYLALSKSIKNVKTIVTVLKFKLTPKYLSLISRERTCKG